MTWWVARSSAAADSRKPKGIEADVQSRLTRGASGTATGDGAVAGRAGARPPVEGAGSHAATRRIAAVQLRRKNLEAAFMRQGIQNNGAAMRHVPDHDVMMRSFAHATLSCCPFDSWGN